MNPPAAVVEAYLRGKDGHAPALAREAFAADARLEVRNRTTAVDFPAVTEGRDAIVDVLVTQFGAAYANVRSLCLARPAPAATVFACDWLVGMTARADGTARVGAGRYEWTFRTTPAWRASALVITIDAMQVLAAADATAILAWLGGLPYPWTSAGAALSGAPRLDGLDPVLARLRQGVPA